MNSMKVLLFAAAFAFAVSLVVGQGQSIVNTKHNLSVSGPGQVRATSEDRVCIFCHTPHGARDVAPLWNRRDPISAYIPYDSPTLKAKPGQPTGSSKLCLSCHDGTIALGDLVSEDVPIAMTGGGTMPPGPGLIGTDLRDDHPISFPYSESYGQQGGELAPPHSWDNRVRLDADGMMQCTACHDAHDDSFGKFLVMDNMQSMLCRQCHTIFNFDQTPHATSSATWSGGGSDPWPHTEYNDVQSNACMNCHRSHHAGGREGLLTYEREEETCLVCHDGSMSRGNLRSVFNKPFRHPVERSIREHQAGESPLAAAGHVECADCHNPHRARTANAQAPFVMGVLEGVSGLTLEGQPISEATYEYEVCFKCHTQRAPTPLRTIPRKSPNTNLADEFSPASPSFHPVVTTGKSMDVPSLLPPYNEGSLIYCSDCHGNDTSSLMSGDSGPHGSNIPFMLKAQYQTEDPVTESPNAYALCYQCHSRESILSDESFPYHRLHIVDSKASCAVCHDAHGIDFGEGNAMNNSHLINFNLSVVYPDTATGMLEFRSLGPRMGECNLNCHGTNHSGTTYP